MAASSLLQRVNRILAGHAMHGQGEWFIQYAAQNHIDLGLLIGIAGAETTWGDAGTGRASQGYGAFGVGPRVRYGSYKEAIAAAAHLLANSYHQWSRPGKANAGGMAPKWVGYSAPSWVQTVSKFANTLGGGKPGKGGGGGGSYYINPYHGFAGDDQGTDWTMKGPIGAVGKAQIVRSEAFSFRGGATGKTLRGWIVAYKLLEGPMKGRVIYVGENLKPGKGVKVGAIVQKGQTVAIAGGVWPYIETGWADAGGHYGSTTYAQGKDFHAFLDRAGSYTGPPAGAGPTGAGPSPSPGGPAPYQPHYQQDLAGTLGSPGQDPIMDVGPQPASVANMWNSIAALNNPSPETMTFAQRAQMWQGTNG